MANENKRYIDIDADTRVGYNYIKQQYYVTNKEYTTYRDTYTLIKEVLTSLEITPETYPDTYPTDNELLELKSYTEDLYKVSYTLQNTGAYIHTLQFNDFAEYPLTIDCEKAKLYIMNSTIIYDLTLNESPKNVRIPRILSFYKDTLGLLIPVEAMNYFYSLLVSYYYPTCYNQVMKTSTGKYFYNNKFLLSNYSKTSLAVYQCTCNPNNTATNTTISHVIATDTSSNSIITDQPVENLLQGYDTVIVKGADTYIPDIDTTYSANGTYTISSIKDNNIVVEETMPYAYTFTYKECHILAAEYEISEMSRTNSTITLTNLPADVLVGDIILVTGATVTSPYETISCNGTYTVLYIEDNTITVKEEIPTDFTGSATLIKEVFISNISSIENKVLTLTNATELNLTDATILIHTIGDTDTTIEPYTVTSYTTNTITVTEPIENYSYTSTCAALEIPVPQDKENNEVLIEVTSVSDKAQEVFPTGEFMVDNFAQCQAYIKLLKTLVYPTNTTKDNLYKELPTDFILTPVPDLTTAKTTDIIQPPIESMEFKGLYNEVYSEI